MPKRQGRDSFVFVVGKRGSGKSSWLKQYARGFGRVLVWDPKNEYGPALGVEPVRDLVELADRRHEPRLVFVPPVVSPAVFDYVARLVYQNRPRSLFLVEELGAVSRSANLIQYWDLIEREGRHAGIEVAAATQRPAWIDGQVIANATRLIVFRLGHHRDRQTMAAELDVHPDTLRLPPLQFIDFDVETERTTPGRIVFAR